MEGAERGQTAGKGLDRRAGILGGVRECLSVE